MAGEIPFGVGGILAKHGVEILPQLLVAMDATNPVAANWYRTVYEEIVARELSRDGTNWPDDIAITYRRVT